MPARAAVLDRTTWPVVAAAVTVEATVAGDADGVVDRTSAATPATCGVAIDVPLIEPVAALPVYRALVMPTPGAHRDMGVSP